MSIDPLPEPAQHEVLLRIERAQREAQTSYTKRQAELRADCQKRGLTGSTVFTGSFMHLLLDQLRQDLKSIWSEYFTVAEARRITLGDGHLRHIQQSIEQACSQGEAHIRAEMQGLERPLGIPSVQQHLDREIAQIQKEAIADANIRYYEHQRKSAGASTFAERRARVLRVMIASPGDVSDERNIAREVVNEWNDFHSDEHGIVLLPVGWDTHSYPSMGDRPQAIINKQVLSRADILVAVFWTRLGTPTGAADSGTVEEIERHVAAGKPAMLYFSSAPVRPDRLQADQYKALQAFKDRCKTLGLLGEYEDVESFRRMLARQLTQLVWHQFASPKPTEGHSLDSELPAALSDEAKRILAEATQDQHGAVLAVRSSSGFTVQTHGVAIYHGTDARIGARWQAAIQELANAGLIEDRAGKGQVFFVTDQGYRVADWISETPG